MSISQTFAVSPAFSRPANDALRNFPRTFAIAALVMLAVSVGNLADPIIRYDDYPALLAQPEGFWIKTLTEGRWLNYLWHLRGVVTPAWLNFALYQLLWAAIATAIACAATSGNDRRWFTVVLMLALLPTPPVLLMAPWSNTVIPGFAVLALFGWLALYLPQRRLRLLLPPFTLAAFAAYTTFPIILFVICLISTRSRSLRDLLALTLLFAASLAVAVLMIYAVNWQVHGVFGIQLDPRRSPDLARDLPAMIAHLPLLRETFTVLINKLSFHSGAMQLFHATLLVLATAVLLRHNRLEALYLWCAMLTGLALMVLQVLKLGVTIPVRAFHFTWILYAIMILRAAQELSRDDSLAGRLARNAVLLVAVSYLVQSAVQYTLFRPWQQDTRAMAQALSPLPGKVHITGDVRNYPSARQAGLHEASSLIRRIQLLGARDAVLCTPDHLICAQLPDALRNPKPQRNPQWFVEHHNGVTVLVFPPQAP